MTRPSIFFERLLRSVMDTRVKPAYDAVCGGCARACGGWARGVAQPVSRGNYWLISAACALQKKSGCVLAKSDYLKLQISWECSIQGTASPMAPSGPFAVLQIQFSGDRHDRAQSLAFFARIAPRDQRTPAAR